jgi:hypothetical protein
MEAMGIFSQLLVLGLLAAAVFLMMGAVTGIIKA